MVAHITDARAQHITLLYCCLLVMLGLSGAILGPSLPSFETLTGASTKDIAWLFTAKAIGIIIGSRILGKLYDRLPGHRILAGAVMVLAPMLAIVPFVTDLSTLLIITFVAGLAESGLHVGTNALLIRLHGARVGPYINALHFSFGVGAMSAPAALGIAFERGGGILWPYLGIAILLLALLPFLFILPTPRGRETAGHSTDREQRIPRRLPVLLVLLFFLYVGAESSVSGWIYSYALSLDLADKVAAAWLTSLFWAGLTLGRLGGVYTSKRFALRHILLVDLLGGMAALLWIWFAGGTFVSLAFGTVMFGLMIASFFPTTVAFAGTRMPLTGNITGWFFVGAASGSMVFPRLTGQYFNSYGPETMLITAGGSLLLALGVYGIIRKS